MQSTDLDNADRLSHSDFDMKNWDEEIKKIRGSHSEEDEAWIDKRWTIFMSLPWELKIALAAVEKFDPFSPGQHLPRAVCKDLVRKAGMSQSTYMRRAKEARARLREGLSNWDDPNDGARMYFETVKEMEAHPGMGFCLAADRISSRRKDVAKQLPAKA